MTTSVKVTLWISSVPERLVIRAVERMTKRGGGRHTGVGVELGIIEMFYDLSY